MMVTIKLQVVKLQVMVTFETTCHQHIPFRCTNHYLHFLINVYVNHLAAPAEMLWL